MENFAPIITLPLSATQMSLTRYDNVYYLNNDHILLCNTMLFNVLATI